MTQEQLRSEYKRLSMPKNIKDAKDTIDIFCRFILMLMNQHHRTPYQNEQQNEGRLIAQMLLGKTLSIKMLVDGLEFDSKEGVRLNSVIDPTPIAVLVRNVYESVCMFNLVFRSPQADDEALILYNLWCISGLSYRQRFHSLITTKENQKKQQDEERTIIDLTNSLRETELYKGLDAKNQKKIEDKIKSLDYLITFQGSEVSFESWQSLSNVLGMKEIVRNKVYTYLSLYSHPSYVSVFQFKDMFEKEDNSQGLALFNLQYLFFLLGCFVADYLIVFPESLALFNDRKLIDQIIMNTFNVFARSHGYSINDCCDALGYIN